MFDSIRFSIKKFVDREMLIQWGFSAIKGEHADSTKISYRHDAYYNQGKIEYTYRENDFKNQSLLVVYITSIGKIIYGNNFTPFFDIQHHLRMLLQITHNFDGLVFLDDLPRCKVIRMDPCFIFDVGDLMPFYLEFCANQVYPRRSTHIFNNSGQKVGGKKYFNGVEFITNGTSNKQITRIYDKYEETDDEDAWGKLRVEAEVNGWKSIDSLFEKEHAFLPDLNDEVAASVVNRDLSIIGLDRAFSVDKRGYSRSKPKMRPLDYLLTKDFAHDRDLPVDELVEKYGISPRQVRTWCKRSRELLPIIESKIASPREKILVNGLKVNLSPN